MRIRVLLYWKPDINIMKNWSLARLFHFTVCSKTSLSNTLPTQELRKVTSRSVPAVMYRPGVTRTNYTISPVPALCSQGGYQQQFNPHIVFCST